MVGAALAVVAAPTDSLRFDGDARPDAGGGDIRSPGDDGARGFVPEDHWTLDDDVADVPRLVEVRVRAADADGLDLHEHLVAAERRDGAVPPLDGRRLGEDARGHGLGRGRGHRDLLREVWRGYEVGGLSP